MNQSTTFTITVKEVIYLSTEDLYFNYLKMAFASAIEGLNLNDQIVITIEPKSEPKCPKS